MNTITDGLLFSCPAPSWATDPSEWYRGQLEHHRIAHRTLNVSAWIEQVDEIDMTDGQVTLVRHPAVLMVQFDYAHGKAETYDSELFPIEHWRNGWMPELPANITTERIAFAREAVAELLAAYDGATR